MGRYLVPPRLGVRKGWPDCSWFAERWFSPFAFTVARHIAEVAPLRSGALARVDPETRQRPP